MAGYGTAKAGIICVTRNLAMVMHPLVGGMPVDAAWTSLELLTGKVLPAVS